jgi:hypothetical protein
MSAVDMPPRFAVRQDEASGYFVIDIFWPDGASEQLIGLFESSGAAENWISNDSASALAQLDM